MEIKFEKVDNCSYIELSDNEICIAIQEYLAKREIKLKVDIQQVEGSGWDTGYDYKFIETLRFRVDK